MPRTEIHYTFKSGSYFIAPEVLIYGAFKASEPGTCFLLAGKDRDNQVYILTSSGICVNIHNGMNRAMTDSMLVMVVTRLEFEASF